MVRQEQSPETYKLQVKHALVDTVFPGASQLSYRFASRFPRTTDAILRRKFDSFPNQEVHDAARENVFNYEVRFLAEPLDQPPTIDTLEEHPFTRVTSRELPSGVTKLTARVSGKKVTSFVTPSDFVPYSFRTMDLLPEHDEQIAVSATLRRVGKAVKKEQGFPGIAVASSGWNQMILFGDEVRVRSQDGKPVQEHAQRHIQETMIGADTRAGAIHFTIDDFFRTLTDTPLDSDTVKMTQLPGQEAYWFVTRKDGTVRPMSLSNLQAADATDESFRSTVASITSTVAYVDEEIAQADHPSELPKQLLNGVVLFALNGQMRTGSIHGKFDTDVLSMYVLTKQLMQSQFPGAENVAIGVLDGGGSSGAVVQKTKHWRTAEKTRLDKSTLPHRLVSHEVPTYTVFVHKDAVEDLTQK